MMGSIDLYKYMLAFLEDILIQFYRTLFQSFISKDVYRCLGNIEYSTDCLSAFQLKKNPVDAHFLCQWVTRIERVAWYISEENV